MRKVLNLICITLFTFLMMPYSFIMSYPHVNQNIKLESDYYYQSFINYSIDDGFYYGRILKYYYANHIIVSDDDIQSFNEILTDVDLTNIQQALMVQNILASTINLSIYGSSSDAEFFAEAFTKWLTTPDDQKNKSWEVTNHFFLNIFPKLIKDGFVLDSVSNEKIKSLIAEDLKTSSNLNYNTTLTKKPSNSLNLRYDESYLMTLDQLYWMGNTLANASGTGALYYLENQDWVDSTSSSQLGVQNQEITELMKGWMYDSYTPASAQSIKDFNEYIMESATFTTFENLNNHLLEVSVDRHGNARLPFKDIYEAYAEKYLPTKSHSDSEILLITNELEEQTLYLYNMLYALVDEKSWVDNILTAFVIAEDDILVHDGDKNMKNTMGYTNSFSYVDNKDNFSSSAYSLMVLRPDSLDSIDFNDNYTNAFWSSPSKYTVLFHEMGHALDFFGAKLNENRSNTFKEVLYNDVYQGVYIFNYENSIFSIANILYMGAGILVGIIVIIGFISITIIILSKKKAKH